MTRSSDAVRGLRARRLLAAVAVLSLGLAGALLPVTAASAAGVATGRVVDQVGDPVVGVEVRILCSGAGNGTEEIQRVDTDADGEFVTVSLPAGDCQAYLFEGEADVDGQWVSTALEFFTVAAAPVTIPDLEVARYVPVSGTIANWTPQMGNVSVSLYYEVIPGTWQMINNTPRPNYYDSVGPDFILYSPLDAVDYTIRVQTLSNVPYLDSFLGGELDDAAAADHFTGLPNVGVEGLSTEMPAAAAISGRVTSGDTPLAGIEVDAESTDGYGYDETDASGFYTLYVRPGGDYAVYAYGDNNHPGEYYYSGSDPCGCEYDPVETSLGDPAEGIDFDLAYDPGPVDIEAIALNPDTGPIDAIAVRLYRASGDGWILEATQTTDLDGDWPGVSFDDRQQGAYRLQFANAGGRILTVVDGELEVDNEQPTDLEPVPACYAELGQVGDDVLAIAALDEGAAAGACSALPAPTTATPPGSGTNGGPRPPAARPAVVAPTVTPTPTPTPTSTPTPTASPSATPNPPAVDPADSTSASPPDLWWLLWVGIGLLLVVVIGGVVFFVRRA